MNLHLQGRRGIVTGASSGIGRAVALQLAAEGVNLVLIARRGHLLRELAEEIVVTYPSSALALPADLSQPDSADQAMREATMSLGGLDILVNNAGSSRFGGFDDVSEAMWREAIDLKLLGYVRCIRAALEPMREQGSGAIINVIGMAGRSASPTYVLGAINAAFLHLTKSLSESVAGDGIRVMAINPGMTRTNRMEAALYSWAASTGTGYIQYLDAYLSERVPLRRFVEPDEVAVAIAYLCSDHAAMATGSAIQLDGGAARGVF